MEFSEICNEYINLLWKCFQYDVNVFSQWWLYAPLLIPATVYAFFFAAKWVFLTLPIWAPIKFIFDGIAKCIK